MDESTLNAMFSSASSEWATPQQFFDKYNERYHFTLDAAASPENAKVAAYFTQEDDGLAQPWGGHGSRVWCNPPYGGGCIKLWVEKAVQEALSGATVVMLLPVRSDSAWFHDLALKYGKIEFVRGRMTFGGSNNRAPFPSMVVIFDAETVSDNARERRCSSTDR